MIENSEEEKDESKNKDSVNLWTVTKSVFAAMFGIQSSKNRERDFTKGKFHHYVIIGLVATLLFIFTLVTLVSWIMPN